MTSLLEKKVNQSRNTFDDEAGRRLMSVEVMVQTPVTTGRVNGERRLVVVLQRRLVRHLVVVIGA